MILPDILEEIWDNAFRNCRRLREIRIPRNVTYIDSETFTGCMGIRRIYLETDKIPGNGWVPDEIREKVSIVRMKDRSL